MQRCYGIAGFWRAIAYPPLVFLLYAGLAYADRDDPIRRDFSINGEPKRIYYDVIGFDDVSDTDIEAWKVMLADWVEKYWRIYEENGLRSPFNEKESGVKTLRYFHDEGGNFGNAGPSGKIHTQSPKDFAVGDGMVQLEATIAHETFHSVQYRYKIFSRYTENLREGMATYVPEIADNGTRNLVLNDANNCNAIYLRGSAGSFFFRPGGDDESNVCAVSLWWKYLAQQFAGDGPNARLNNLDAMRRLLESLQYFGGWRSAGDDALLFTDDFNGDDIDDFLIRSDRYIGIVSRPFWEPRTLDVKTHNGWIEESWKFQHSDRIPVACDFYGDERKEIFIVSETHLGVIAVDRHGVFRAGPVKGADAIGTASGPGSLVKSAFLGGDFDGDGKCEVVVANDAGIKILDIDAGNILVTAHAIVGDRVDVDGWRFRPRDKLVVAGDFDGDGRDEFLLRNSQYVGAIGLDETGVSFETVAANFARHRIDGSEYKVGIGANDIVFVGRFTSGDRDVIAKIETNQIVFFPVRSNRRGFRLDGGARMAARAPSMIVADLDGDDVDELVERTNSEGLRSIEPTGSGGVTVAMLAPAGAVLDDGENGAEFRSDFTIDGDIRFEATGDYNGDGTDDLAVCKGNFRQMLYTHATDGAISFTIDRPIRNGDRYYGLAAGVDKFIQQSSGSDREARDLPSIFRDFALANVLTRTPDAPSRHRYVSTDDTEDLSFNHEFDVAGTEDAQDIQQDPWAISYVKIERAMPGHTKIEAEATEPLKTPQYYLLVMEGDRLINQFAGTGAYFAQTIALQPSQHAILIAVSFEAPLQYEARVTP